MEEPHAHAQADRQHVSELLGQLVESVRLDDQRVQGYRDIQECLKSAVEEVLGPATRVTLHGSVVDRTGHRGCSDGDFTIHTCHPVSKGERNDLVQCICRTGPKHGFMASDIKSPGKKATTLTFLRGQERYACDLAFTQHTSGHDVWSSPDSITELFQKDLDLSAVTIALKHIQVLRKDSLYKLSGYQCKALALLSWHIYCFNENGSMRPPSEAIGQPDRALVMLALALGQFCPRLLCQCDRCQRADEEVAALRGMSVAIRMRDYVQIITLESQLGLKDRGVRENWIRHSQGILYDLCYRQIHTPADLNQLLQGSAQAQLLPTLPAPRRLLPPNLCPSRRPPGPSLAKLLGVDVSGEALVLRCMEEIRSLQALLPPNGCAPPRTPNPAADSGAGILTAAGRRAARKSLRGQQQQGHGVETTASPEIQRPQQRTHITKARRDALTGGLSSWSLDGSRAPGQRQEVAALQCNDLGAVGSIATDPSPAASSSASPSPAAISIVRTGPVAGMASLTPAAAAAVREGRAAASPLSASLTSATANRSCVPPATAMESFSTGLDQLVTGAAASNACRQTASSSSVNLQATWPGRLSATCSQIELQPDSTEQLPVLQLLQLQLQDPNHHQQQAAASASTATAAHAAATALGDMMNASDPGVGGGSSRLSATIACLPSARGKTHSSPKGSAQQLQLWSSMRGGTGSSRATAIHSAPQAVVPTTPCTPPSPPAAAAPLPQAPSASTPTNPSMFASLVVQAQSMLDNARAAGQHAQVNSPAAPSEPLGPAARPMTSPAASPEPPSMCTPAAGVALSSLQHQQEEEQQQQQLAMAPSLSFDLNNNSSCGSAFTAVAAAAAAAAAASSLEASSPATSGGQQDSHVVPSLLQTAAPALPTQPSAGLVVMLPAPKWHSAPSRHAWGKAAASAVADMDADRVASGSESESAGSNAGPRQQDPAPGPGPSDPSASTLMQILPPSRWERQAASGGSDGGSSNATGSSSGSGAPSRSRWMPASGPHISGATRWIQASDSGSRSRSPLSTRSPGSRSRSPKRSPMRSPNSSANSCNASPARRGRTPLSPHAQPQQSPSKAPPGMAGALPSPTHASPHTPGSAGGRRYGGARPLPAAAAGGSGSSSSGGGSAASPRAGAGAYGGVGARSGGGGAARGVPHQHHWVGPAAAPAPAPAFPTCPLDFVDVLAEGEWQDKFPRCKKLIEFLNAKRNEAAAEQLHNVQQQGGSNSSPFSQPPDCPPDQACTDSQPQRPQSITPASLLNELCTQAGVSPPEYRFEVATPEVSESGRGRGGGWSCTAMVQGSMEGARKMDLSLLKVEYGSGK